MTRFAARRHAPGLALVFALALAPWAAVPLAAHDFWIVPSSFRPAAGAPLAVRLKVGEHLRGDPVPRDAAQVERFALVGPAGEVPIAGPDGAEPAGYAHLTGEGLHWIVYDSARTRLDLPAEKFEESLRLEGLERISALRKKRGESGKPSREVFSRCAKSLVRVGGAGPGAPRPPSALDRGFDRRLGLELELVPERDPAAISSGSPGSSGSSASRPPGPPGAASPPGSSRSGSQASPGGELPLRLLFRGKPLAGALVTALHARHADGAIAARTGPDGRVRLALPSPGFWLIKSVHMVPAPADAGVDWESLWASLTFELPAP